MNCQQTCITTLENETTLYIYCHHWFCSWFSRENLDAFSYIHHWRRHRHIYLVLSFCNSLYIPHTVYHVWIQTCIGECPHNYSFQKQQFLCFTVDKLEFHLKALFWIYNNCSLWTTKLYTRALMYFADHLPNHPHKGTRTVWSQKICQS